MINNVNALRRSMNAVPVTHPLSILSRTCSMKAIKAVEVERLVGSQTVIVTVICFLPKRNLTLTEFVLISL